MIKKRDRLTSPELRAVFDGGRSIFGKELTLIYLKSENPKSGFSFSVSSKHWKTAVARNALRRKLYRASKPSIARLEKGFACAFVAKPAAGKASPKELSFVIEELLGKAGAIRSR